jgi:hypothetical protein
MGVDLVRVLLRNQDVRNAYLAQDDPDDLLAVLRDTRWLYGLEAGGTRVASGLRGSAREPVEAG